MSLPFLKMHGAGNDFVIFDARLDPIRLTAGQVREISARSNVATQGCDQLIVLEPSAQADVFMRIYNADGGEVDACGNATRCVGWLLMQEKKRPHVSIQTKVDILECQSDEQGLVIVDMGLPKLGWRDIPLAHEIDTLHTGIRISDTLYDPVAVSMGNPHAVFFVTDPALLATTGMAKVSELLQPFYPQGVNVSVAYIRKNDITAPAIIDVRVWERGVGETLACGTAACAVMVAAALREPFPTQADIRFQPGGHQLHVMRRGDNHILLSGPVEVEFEGAVEL